MPDFNDIYERMRIATGCRTQMELADVLEIRQSSISDAKRRDSVPGDWYMKLFDRFGLNPDWLKQGVGPLYLRANGQYGAFDASAGLSEQAAAFGEPRTKGQLVSVYDMRCDYSDRKARPALTSQRSVCLPMSCLGEKTVVLEMALALLYRLGSDSGSLYGTTSEPWFPDDAGLWITSEAVCRSWDSPAGQKGRHGQEPVGGAFRK